MITHVDYSTLNDILEETVANASDSKYLISNRNIYTEAISKLRYLFLEPIAKQKIEDTSQLKIPIENWKKKTGKQNFELSQLIESAIRTNIDIKALISSINENTIAKYRSPSNFRLIKLLNEAIHFGQKNISLSQFVSAYYECYSIYNKIYPKEIVTPQFESENEVEKYFLDKFNTTNPANTTINVTKGNNLDKNKNWIDYVFATLIIVGILLISYLYFIKSTNHKDISEGSKVTNIITREIQQDTPTPPKIYPNKVIPIIDNTEVHSKAGSAPTGNIQTGGNVGGVNVSGVVGGSIQTNVNISTPKK